MKKYYPVILIIFFLSLALRLFAVTSMQVAQEGDPASYNILANSIIERMEFSYTPGKPVSWRPPLYPLFLAIIYIIGKHSYLLVGIAQALIGSLTCVFIYWIAMKFFVKAVAVTAGLISACYLYFIVSTKFLMTEVLFIFLLTASIYYFIKAIKKNFLFRDAALSGFLMGLATLTRSITLFLPVFIFIVIFFSRIAGLKILSRFFITALIFFLIPLSAWTTRNYLVHGKLIPVATSGGMNFFIGNTPDENGRYRVRGPSKKETQEMEDIKPKSEVEIDKFYFKKASDYIFTHPRDVVRLIAVKVIFFWSPFDWYFFGNKGVYNYHYAFILPFSLMGMFLCAKKWREYVLLYLPIVYFALISLVFHVETRYRMPIDPFLIIFASYSFFYLYSRHKNKCLPVLIISGLFGINFLLYLYSDVLKQGARHILQITGLW